MVDTWQPGIPTSDLTPEKLRPVAEKALAADDINSTIESLDAAEKQSIASWLKQPETQWSSAIQGLTKEQVMALCRLFTVGEMKITDWTCGSQNPTIYLLKQLKTQGQYPEKEFIRWLKKNTDNRYIPFGNALG